MPYTYLIGWTNCDKWYYGVRYAKDSNPEDLWVDYFTSSKYVRMFREEFGEPDVIEVRKVFDDANTAIAWELNVLRCVKVLNSDRWLNKSIAGQYVCDEDIRRKMSQSHIGKKHNPETIMKLKTTPNIGWMTSERAATVMNTRVENGNHPAINAAKEGRHHWQTEEHSNLISQRNTEMFKESVSVTDKYGRNMRIPKADFLEQQLGLRTDWAYVGVASKEAKERRQHAYTN